MRGDRDAETAVCALPSRSAEGALAGAEDPVAPVPTGLCPVESCVRADGRL
ncbi:hypothetical protein ACH4ZX_15485 [Streptomyces sp. NPDC020490]|uniref:hypothetical protein n=1 Tax=Streptomyces sp. NPDC020490 TaxID=3365078 RepID=UPI0037A62FC6